jgi:hypothetical protein
MSKMGNMLGHRHDKVDYIKRIYDLPVQCLIQSRLCHPCLVLPVNSLHLSSSRKNVIGTDSRFTSYYVHRPEGKKWEPLAVLILTLTATRPPLLHISGAPPVTSPHRRKDHVILIQPHNTVYFGKCLQFHSQSLHIICVYVYMYMYIIYIECRL